ncbi:MAG: uracil phosphoribosyltransferase [Oscillospiraceae bacterium]|jgi:uracil phosphoribosyltransferase|nr:uracil phosphoribosyltransferase [Oscillospiraceae bacterium]
MSVTIVNHPCLQHKITLLRDSTTENAAFRALLLEVTQLLAYEATRSLPLENIQISTPLGDAQSPILGGRKPAVVALMRAGLGMADGVLRLLPSAPLGHIGVFRDPETREAKTYYCKLPADLLGRTVLVIDAVLATGHTAAAACGLLKRAGAGQLDYLSVLAAPEGIIHLQKVHPDVSITCGHLDEGLNEDGFIIPGFGDLGRRLFGTA